MRKKLIVADLIDKIKPTLELKKSVVSDLSLKNEIQVPDINRAGLALSGFFDYFESKRIQIIGKTEITYLNQLSEKDRIKRIKDFMMYKMPCVIFSRNMKIPKEFIEEAKRNDIALLKSPITTTRLVGNLTVFLEDAFAPREVIHGTLMDVHGVGVLLRGGSGVGKSECALELVERGHRLVCDDVVLVKRMMGSYLLGSGTSFIRHHMEIRGLGIIDVRSIYGASAVRNQKRIGFAVDLEAWDPNKEYERLGLEEKTFKLLGIATPYFVIPVKPGRNLAILIEVAASTQRLKKMGVNPVLEIEKKMFDAMSMSYDLMDGSF